MLLPASFDYVFGDTDRMWQKAAQEIGEQIISPLLNDVPLPEDPACN
jgi:hypothetical protein